ncbi:exodeoxyribonuclease VII small subunit [bacterium]|nr:exodeoxyribonuclease VII small subunit [bacterium]
MSQTKEKVSFETSLKELEKIVGELETGDTPLEAQLKAFEKGVALSRECLKQLEEVERTVELLMQNASGEFQTSPFEVSEKTP